jgi:diguanylate cyclase (GGDEF)-like protein
MKIPLREDENWEGEIATLLQSPEYAGHPLREALRTLYAQYEDQITQLEKLTSISDGYQSALRESNQTLNERYCQQIRQLQKIIRISDHYQQMLQETNEKLKIASTRDPLTDLPNRRFLQERIESETAKVERGNGSFSLALLDIDHFKQIIDAWGHHAGDKALVGLAKLLKNQLRLYDVCGRWGGEEFLILLPDTTGEAALDIASRLCAKVDSMTVPELPDGIRLSVSIGIAHHSPDEKWDETLKHADDALYAAKHGGRNRVSLFQAAHR